MAKYKLTKQHKDLEIQRIQREIEDNFVSFDKDGNLVIDKDIKCRSLYVEGDSLYIAGIKVKSPVHSDDDGYWKYNRDLKQFDFTPSAAPAVHASEHEAGGADEIDLDELSGIPTDMFKMSIAMSIALGMP